MPVTCPARQLTATESRAYFVGVSQHNGSLKVKDLLCIWSEEFKDIQQYFTCLTIIPTRMLQAGRIPNQESIPSLPVRTSIGKEKLFNTE